jgi:hypothetical protein
VNDRDDFLYRAAVETLESLCSMVPVLDSPRAAAPREAAVGVAFEGSRRGRLDLAFHGKAATDVAARLTGEAPDSADGQDALAEVANVICGNVLPALFGSESLFRMGRADPPPDGERAGPGPLAFARVPFSSGLVELSVWVEEAP